MALTTIQTADNRKGYEIPTRNDRHEDEFHVSVRLTNRKTKCYHTRNSDGWQDRIRSFVDRTRDRADCRVDTVTVSHVRHGERLSQKRFGLRFRDGTPSFIEL